MTYSPPLPPQPAPAPAKKPFYKKAWFIVLAVLAVIGIATSQGGGTDTTPDASDGGSSADAPADGAPATGDPADADATSASAVGIGQPALDGDFQFVVNGVDCSQTTIGTEYLNTQAQGQFCMVDLTISNIGSEAQSFLGDNAKLFNAEGQQFSADTEAAFYLENSSSLYEEINPGNTLSSKVVFDVPVGMVPTSIELHDSMFSGGVTVALA
jgi:hypothetical protein